MKTSTHHKYSPTNSPREKCWQLGVSQWRCPCVAEASDWVVNASYVSRYGTWQLTINHSAGNSIHSPAFMERNRKLYPPRSAVMSLTAQTDNTHTHRGFPHTHTQRIPPVEFPSHMCPLVTVVHHCCYKTSSDSVVKKCICMGWIQCKMISRRRLEQDYF